MASRHCLALVLACVLSFAAAQDAQGDCSAAVHQATYPLKTDIEAYHAQVKHLEGELSKAHAGCAVEKAALHDSLAKMQKTQDSHGSQVAQLKTQLQAEREATAAARAALSGKQQELALKQQELEDARKAVDLSFGDALAALIQAAITGIYNAWAELNAIMVDLISGKTDRLFAAWAAGFRTIGSVFGFVLKLVDKHLPESVKFQIAAISEKVSGLVAQLLAAPWAQPAVSFLSKTNAEVKDVILKAMKGVPVLAPYADPEVVQLVVYGLLGLPLLLLVVLPLALATGGPKKESSTVKKGKKKGPPRRA